MVDKRIRKTKKNLKATLIEMMNEIPFEEITITDLCKQADISRITFYSHYNDKYALIDDFFQDMSHIGSDIYRQLQIENNPGHDHVQSYCNIRHSLQSLYHTYYDFFLPHQSRQKSLSRIYILQLSSENSRNIHPPKRTAIPEF